MSREIAKPLVIFLALVFGAGFLMGWFYLGKELFTGSLLMWWLIAGMTLYVLIMNPIAGRIDRNLNQPKPKKPNN